MKYLNIMLLTNLLFAQMAGAQVINTADLGRLTLEYQTVSQVDAYPGQSLAAQVSFRQGEAFSVVTPYRVQQLSYLLQPGAEVSAGQPIAVLQGPEIHHFLSEFDVKKQLLMDAEKRYNNNLALYEKQAIKASQWLQISEDYYTLKLEFEHMRHFHELLIEEKDRQEDSVTITAPVAGVIEYSQGEPGIAADGEIAVIAPRSAIRLKVHVPAAQRTHLSGFRTDECTLEVAIISGIVSDFFVETWSDPLPADCQFLPGQQLMVTPYFKLPAYQVARSSVFQWQGQAHLFLRDGDQLVATPVELVSTTGSDYFVITEQPILDREVLVSSVSAVQGILMGLGGE